MITANHDERHAAYISFFEYKFINHFTAKHLLFFIFFKVRDENFPLFGGFPLFWSQKVTPPSSMWIRCKMGGGGGGVGGRCDDRDRPKYELW